MPKTIIDPADYRVTGYEPFEIPGINVRLMRAITKRRRAAVPAIDPGYVFREAHVRDLATCIWPSDEGQPLPMLLTGPKGSGKTSLVIQIAAHCNEPVYRANMNVGTSVRHLKGRVGAQKGATVFVPGVATLAMENGAWLVLDEISGMTPPVALSLFPVLEPDGEVLLEDAQPPRYVNRHNRFRVFGTDNVIGNHMESDRFSYRGTNPDMNVALLDRFGGMVEIGYLEQEAEYKAVVSKCPKIDPDALSAMVNAANDIRVSEECPSFSTRMISDWARFVAMGKLDGKGRQMLGDDYQIDQEWVMACADLAFLRKQRTGGERTAMSEIITRHFEA